MVKSHKTAERKHIYQSQLRVIYISHKRSRYIIKKILQHIQTNCNSLVTIRRRKKYLVHIHYFIYITIVSHALLTIANQKIITSPPLLY